MSEKEFLDVVLRSKNQNDKWKFTNVGYATKSEYNGEEQIEIRLDKGVSISSLEGVFISIKKRKPRGDDPFV
jgi:hypothetical protein